MILWCTCIVRKRLERSFYEEKINQNFLTNFIIICLVIFDNISPYNISVLEDI